MYREINNNKKTSKNGPNILLDYANDIDINTPQQMWGETKF